jgi:hypothetical protein
VSGIVAGLAAVSAPTPEQVRRTAEEVFARPEFAPDAGRPNWLLRALAEFFRWLGTLYTANPLLFWVLLIGCILLLILILGHIIYTVVRAFRGGGIDARRRQQAEAEARRGRLSAAYRAEAGRHAARGEFTEAIRALFLSLVYRYDEKGRVSLHKAWTNREYLTLLDEDLPAREQLAVFVDALDDHWYGQRPAGAEQYERCQALYDRLVAV